MELITLNIWGGHVRYPLIEFIKSHEKVDIFCIQEVYNNAQHKISNDDNEVNLKVFSELHALLPEHNGYFTSVVDSGYGIGIFINKKIDILEKGDINIHENLNYPGRGPTHSRKLQWLKCRFNNKIFYVLNVHGLWNGKGKTDTLERLIQSRKIRGFMDSLKDPKILCGDFNLKPDTESISILEKGMENLIKSYNIHSTRTVLYPKEEKFADYIFISPEIKVNNFEVLKNVVSDHAPLLLNFSLSTQ